MRKFLSVLFAAIMIMSLLPMNAYAADESVHVEVIREGITITQLGASAYKVEGIEEEEGYSWYFYPRELGSGESLIEGIESVIKDYVDYPVDREHELGVELNDSRIMTKYSHWYFGEHDMSEYDYVDIIKKKDGDNRVYAIAVLPLSKESPMGHSTGVHAEATWTALDQTTGEIGSGYYYLSTELSTSRVIAEGADVVICLNGHTWSPSSGATWALKVSTGATVRICDCSSSEEPGKITGNVTTTTDATSTIELHSGTIKSIWNQYTTNLTFNMYGGTIDATGAYGIFLDGENGSCNINMYGGVIVGTNGIRVNQKTINGTINIYGGEIKATADRDCYGIWYLGNGAINISGGLVEATSNAATGTAVHGFADKVNISGDAIIYGKQYGISFGNDASSAGTNKRPKLTISGKPYIGCEAGQAIRVFNSIDIEGQPRIDGKVNCGSYPNSDSPVPYSMFNITGDFTVEDPIQVVRTNANLVIARAWETYGFSRDDIANYFTGDYVAYSVENDEVYFNIGWTLTTSPIEFKNGNKIECENGATSASLETLYTYKNDSYTISVTCDGVNYIGKFVDDTFVIEGVNGASLVSGTYKVILTQSGKTASNAVNVIVEVAEPEAFPAPEVIPVVSAAPGKLQIVHSSNQTLGIKVKKGDVELVPWTQYPFEKDKVLELPLGPGEFTVYFCHTEAMTPDGTDDYNRPKYNVPEASVKATDIIRVEAKVLTEDNAPTVDTSHAGVIHISNTTNEQFYFKVEDAQGNTIKKWSEELRYIPNASVGPLEAGEYKVIFCYKDDYNYGSPTAVCEISVTVTEPGYKEGSFDVENNEYIIDYKDGENVKVSIALNHLTDEDNVDKYYTFDEIDWYKLPDDEDVKIVVTNTDPSVEPKTFTCSGEPDYSGGFLYVFDWNVTFRNVSIGNSSSSDEEVYFGAGNVILTIEGDVYVEAIRHWGKLVVAGKDNDDTFTTNEMVLDDSNSSLIIKDIKKVTFVEMDNWTSINVCYGSLTFLNIDVLDANLGTGKIYAGANVLFENVKNFSINGTSLCVFAGYGSDVIFKNSFGSVTRVSDDGYHAIEATNVYVILDKPTEIKSGATAETATLITLNDDDSVTLSEIGQYFEIVGTPVSLPEVSTPENTDSTVKVGGTVTLEVNATGEDLQYQWQVKENGVFKDIENANGATYVAKKFDKCGDVYEYRCIVSNEAGEVESATLKVTVKHTLKEVEANEATCTEDGNYAYDECTVENCGKIFVNGVETTLEAVTIEKTNHADGNGDEVCDECETDLHVHVLTKVPAKDATCTENGNYEYYECGCGELFADKDGKETTTAIAVVIPATNHADTNKDEVCDVCATDLHEHVLTKVPAVSATCETAGNKEYYTCNCGKLFADKDCKETTTEAAVVIAATGHTDADKDEVCDACEEDLHKNEVETHKHELVKVPAVSATCTTAGNKEYYKCNCGELFADEKGTTATTLEETVIDALGHDWTGEWTTTKEATETEEGKKETHCENGCGQKKVVTIPKVGETDENGTLEKDAEVAPEAPVEEATLNNSKNDFLEADGIFTEEEKAEIEKGEDARVWLEIDKVEAIEPEDKVEVENKAAEILGEDAEVTYFDIKMFAQVGENKRPIYTPGVDIEITILIPEELLNHDKTIVREYKIIRLHDGKADPISGVFDEETGTFTFKTDRFSTYAIAYGDAPAVDKTPDVDETPEVPNTGDSNMVYAYIMMLVCGLGICLFVRKKNIGN